MSDTAVQPLPDPLVTGRVLFALGLAGLGVQNIMLVDFVFELQPVPDWFPGRALFAGLTGLALILGSAALLARYRVRLVASLLGLMLSAWVLLLHLPKVIADPSRGGAWTSGFEIFALAGAAAILAASAPASGAIAARWNRVVDAATTPGRFCFGISLPVFAVLHFIYYEYVASVIPAWIPAPVFWAYFTGVAHFAAGLSIVTGVLSRLAATLLGLMFGSWVLILHIPRVVASPDRREWTSLLVATALCGGAWLVVSSLAKSRETGSRTRPETRDAGAPARTAGAASVGTGAHSSRADNGRMESRVHRLRDDGAHRLLAERIARLAGDGPAYGQAATAIALEPIGRLDFGTLLEPAKAAGDAVLRALPIGNWRGRDPGQPPGVTAARKRSECIDPAVLQRYEGRYAVSGEGIFTLRVAADRLTIEAPSHWNLGIVQLRAESSCGFVAHEPPLRVSMQIDDGGSVRGMLIHAAPGHRAVPAHRC